MAARGVLAAVVVDAGLEVRGGRLEALQLRVERPAARRGRRQEPLRGREAREARPPEHRALRRERQLCTSGGWTLPPGKLEVVA